MRDDLDQTMYFDKNNLQKEMGPREVLREVYAALEAKGYRYQAEHGDLRVIYALGLQRQPGLEMRPVITQDGVFTQTQLTEDTEARLALRILDESNGRVLLESVLSRQLHDPALTQEAFDRGVAQLLKDFPSRSQP